MKGMKSLRICFWYLIREIRGKEVVPGFPENYSAPPCSRRNARISIPSCSAFLYR